MDIGKILARIKAERTYGRDVERLNWALVGHTLSFRCLDQSGRAWPWFAGEPGWRRCGSSYGDMTEWCRGQHHRNQKQRGTRKFSSKKGETERVGTSIEFGVDDDGLLPLMHAFNHGQASVRNIYCADDELLRSLTDFRDGGTVEYNVVMFNDEGGKYWRRG